MKNVAELGEEFGAVQIELERVPEGMLLGILRQGAKYFIDASLSHKRAQVNKDLAEGRNLTAEEAAAVLADISTRFYDPDWKPRSNGAEPMSDFEKAIRELVRAKFYDLGVIRRANKKTDQGALTLENFLAQYDSVEDAVRAVAEAQIRAKAPDYSDEKVAAQVDASWSALAAKAAKLVKVWENERKLKAASAKTAEGEHTLDF